jgi:hypothetical protein
MTEPLPEDVERVAMAINSEIWIRTYGEGAARPGKPSPHEFWEKMKESHTFIAKIAIRAMQRGDDQ